MIKVIGVRKSVGTYQDKPYDNIIFYFADTEATGYIAGTVPVLKGKQICQYKIKTSEYDLPYEPAQYVGMTVQLYFDAYGNVSDMRTV